MKTLTPARPRRSMAAGALVLAGLLLGPARTVRAEDNNDNPAAGDCPTWKTCDERCGATPPILDGSPEADAAFDRYLECTNRCLREVFDCITQQVNAAPPGPGGVLDPDPDGDPPSPPLDRGSIVLPKVLTEQSIVRLEPGQVASSADTNADHRVDLSDALRVFNYLFLGGPEPVTIMVAGYPLTETSPQLSPDGLKLIIDGNLVLSSGDTDASGSLDIADPMRILTHLFSDGKEPVEIWARALPRPPRDDRLPDPPIVIGR